VFTIFFSLPTIGVVEGVEAVIAAAAALEQ